MRPEIPALLNPTLLNRETVTVKMFSDASPYDLIVGTLGLTEVDLTPFVSELSVDDTGGGLKLSYVNEFLFPNNPRPGYMIQVKVGPYVAMNAVVYQINAIREARGIRYQTLTFKTRDSFPWWRQVRRTTALYPKGTDLQSIAIDVARNLNLQPEEYTLAPQGIQIVHDNIQLADLNAWDMLTLVQQVALNEPYIDAVGRLKVISRNFSRDPDFTLLNSQIKDLQGGASFPTVTSVQVKWLSPTLQYVEQLAQVLGTASLTAGFFSPSSTARVPFSPDKTQRAKDTYMVVKQSINDGLLPVGRERWTQLDAYGGKVKASINGFLPGLATASLIALIGSSYIPDAVVVAGLGASSGVTIPIGRPINQIAQNILLLSLMTIGHGQYEIIGTPYDYVNVINTSEAFDDSAPVWMQSVAEIRNDMIPNEVLAQLLAVNELFYQNRSAARASITVVDDLRYERGDLIALQDGRRFYVTGYRRNLTRGSEPLVDLAGFFV